MYEETCGRVNVGGVNATGSKQHVMNRLLSGWFRKAAAAKRSKCGSLEPRSAPFELRNRIAATHGTVLE